MIEHLYVVVYIGGLVVGSIGPLVETTETRCRELVAHAQMMQEMRGAALAHFNCEWRRERPHVEAFVR
jgi:hypothetical protein